MVEVDRGSSAFCLEVSPMPRAVSPCLERSHMQAEHWCYGGISHFCSACGPPPVPLDISTPQFIMLHFGFALSAKHLPREEDPVRCRV